MVAATTTNRNTARATSTTATIRLSSAMVSSHFDEIRRSFVYCLNIDFVLKIFDHIYASRRSLGEKNE